KMRIGMGVPRIGSFDARSNKIQSHIRQDLKKRQGKNEVHIDRHVGSKKDISQGTMVTVSYP
ncbi:MAG: hypothetical protein EBY22_03130, partial [Gammaproteobacteria bacterium]|nr:hypothetical protein [Gammaproteobacteria bacterium]